MALSREVAGLTGGGRRSCVRRVSLPTLACSNCMLSPLVAPLPVCEESPF